MSRRWTCSNRAAFATARCPAEARLLIRKLMERRLPAGFDVDTHFGPRYEPSDQRMCILPDGDLIDAIVDGALRRTIRVFVFAPARNWST